MLYVMLEIHRPTQELILPSINLNNSVADVVNRPTQGLILPSINLNNSVADVVNKYAMPRWLNW